MSRRGGPGPSRPPRLLARPAVDLAFAAALGAAHTLTFVHTQLWPAHFAAVALLAWRVSRASTRRAAALGLAFGTAWLAAGTWWLFISLHRYGGLPSWIAVLAVAALSTLLSLYLAAAMAAVARWRGFGRGRGVGLFAAGWLLAELARGVIFTGFPWLASGYAYIDSPLAGFAPWLGVYGMGALVAGAAAAVGLAWGRPRRLLGAATGCAAVLVTGWLAGQVEFTRPTGSISVSLLQGNVPQDEKFSARFLPDALAGTAAQLEAATGQLVVGPETVIPLLPRQLDPAYLGRIAERFRAPGRAALVGIPLGDEETGYSNSALGVSAEAAALPGGFYRYDKHHLVPFGEFIPLGFKWFTRLMNIPLGDFNRGPLSAPSFAFAGERIAPNICYEDLFGEDLAARFVPEAVAPTMLANISNIGWFGQTIAVPQHLNISRLRTLELQRPMLRATNTGATVVVDHRGVITAALAPFTRGVLEARVEGRQGLTPFAQWAGRFGLWPLWALGIGAVLALRGGSRRPKVPRGARRAP